MKRIIPIVLILMLLMSCAAETRTFMGSLELGPDKVYTAHFYAGSDEDDCDIIGGGIRINDKVIDAFAQLGEDSLTYALNGDIFKELNTFGELLSVDNATLEAAYRLMGAMPAEDEDEETRVIVVDIAKYLFDGGLDEDIASFRRVFRSEAKAISRAATAKSAVSFSDGETVLEADTALVFEIIRMYIDGLENDSFSSDEISCTLPWLLMGYTHEGTEERLELVEAVRNTVAEAEAAGADVHAVCRIKNDGSFTMEAEVINGKFSASGTAKYESREFSFDMTVTDENGSRSISGVLKGNRLDITYGNSDSVSNVVIDLGAKRAERSVNEKGFERREALSIQDEKIAYTLVTEEAAASGEGESRLLVSREVVLDAAENIIEYTAQENLTESTGGIIRDGGYTVDTHAVIGNNSIVYDISNSAGDVVKLNAAYEEDKKLEVSVDANLYGTAFTLFKLYADQKGFSLRADRADIYEENGTTTVYAGPWVDMYLNTKNGVEAGCLYDGVMYTFSGRLKEELQRAEVTGKLLADGEEISTLTAGYKYSKPERDVLNASAYLKLPELGYEAEAQLHSDEKNKSITAAVTGGELTIGKLILDYKGADETPAHGEGRALTADETAIMLDRYDRFMSRVYGY